MIALLEGADDALVDEESEPIAWPTALAGDQGYRADWIDETLLAMGITPVIPSKENENRAERPIEFDKEMDRRRNIVELFFRWLKCVLDCRRLLSHSQSGVTLQVYFAIIASLLIGLWTGAKPTKRLYEMLCLDLAGWATEAEVQNQIDKAQQSKPPP